MKDERVKESNQQFAAVYESFDDVLNEKQKKKLSELYDEICNMETEIGLYFSKKALLWEFVWEWKCTRKRGNRACVGRPLLQRGRPRVFYFFLKYLIK